MDVMEYRSALDATCSTFMLSMKTEIKNVQITYNHIISDIIFGNVVVVESLILNHFYHILRSRVNCKRTFSIG